MLINNDLLRPEDFKSDELDLLTQEFLDNLREFKKNKLIRTND